MDLNLRARREALEGLASGHFDVLVVGGGITGAGIAREAALRGYRTALVEKADFASGTSSTSSKLVHGGLRYLEQYDFRLVFEALRERKVLLGIAPHLVRPIRLLFPLYRGRPPRPLRLRAGLALYDLLALGRGLGRHRMISAGEAVERQPGLEGADLRGAGMFSDAWVHDAALVIATVRDAASAGAAVASYLEARVVAPGRVRLADRLEGGELEARARLVVSAVGPWTDRFLRTGLLRPSKGVHLALPHDRLPLQGPLAATSPRDGRLVFLLPWPPYSYVGTTDTPHAGDPDQVRVDEEDVGYLLETTRAILPGAAPTPEMVSGAWAGLRPLLASDASGTYRSSREHAIWESGPRLLAIAGGKLTTYRVMARQCMDAAARVLAREDGLALAPPAPTDQRPLPGGEAGWNRPLDLPDRQMAEYLTRRYGTDAGRVRGAGSLERLAPGVVHSEAEVLHLVRVEGALRLPDVLVRRTHLANLDRASARDVASRVAELMGGELGWSPERRRAEVQGLRAEVPRLPGSSL